MENALIIAALLLALALPAQSAAPGYGSPSYREANSPKEPAFTVAVWEDKDKAVFSTSTDGGSSWSSTHAVPLPSGCASSSAPSVVIDEHNTIVIAFAARSTSSMNTTGGVYVITSTDRGVSFKHRSQLTASNNTVKALQPLLTIDTVSAGLPRNRIYVIWTVVTTRPNKTQWWQLLLSASDNSGQSFSSIPRLRLNWDDAEVTDAAITVNANGVLSVEYTQLSQQIRKLSGNGGITFVDAP